MVLPLVTFLIVLEISYICNAERKLRVPIRVLQRGKGWFRDSNNRVFYGCSESPECSFANEKFKFRAIIGNRYSAPSFVIRPWKIRVRDFTWSTIRPSLPLQRAPTDREHVFYTEPQARGGELTTHTTAVRVIIISRCCCYTSHTPSSALCMCSSCERAARDAVFTRKSCRD